MTPVSWSPRHAATGDAALFAEPSGRTISAMQLRALAGGIAQRMTAGQSPIVLYCEDAAIFFAALVAAFQKEREVLLPGHGARQYLRDVSPAQAELWTDDRNIAHASLHLDAGLADAHGLLDLTIPAQARIGFFTSGSTGEAKICRKTFRQISDEAALLDRTWPGPETRVAGTVSHQHIYGFIFGIVWPLAAGRLCVSRRFELWENLRPWLNAETILVSGPAHLSRIPDGFQATPGRIYSSGGPLDPARAKAVAAHLGRWPVEVLGSTETGGVAWRVQEQTSAPWQALPGIEISSDQSGALLVRSPFSGVDGPVALGDMATILPDGRFALHGRTDRIVKIEGKRVSLTRIEAALAGLDGVEEVCVIDLPGHAGRLGAVIRPNDAMRDQLQAHGAFRLSRQLRQRLSDRLEAAELPRLWRFVGKIPEDMQGKRPIQGLRALFDVSANELPVIRSSEIGTDRAEYELHLQPALRWFEGHFPNNPILPGVAQLHIAAQLAEGIWHTISTGREVARLKFRRVLQAGDTVRLTLLRREGTRVDFTYRHKSEVASTGSIAGVAHD